MPEIKQEKGFEALFEAHAKALENNSKSVVEILKILASKNLASKDKEKLRGIKRELGALDMKIDSLGTYSEEESWW